LLLLLLLLLLPRELNTPRKLNPPRELNPPGELYTPGELNPGHDADCLSTAQHVHHVKPVGQAKIFIFFMQCLLLHYHVNDSETLHQVLISVAASGQHLRSTASTVLYEHVQKSLSDHIMVTGTAGTGLWSLLVWYETLFRAVYMPLPTVEPYLHNLGM